MRDLLVITPTRHRPASAERLAKAVAATRLARTDLVLCVDDDDASYDGTDLNGAQVIRGPRRNCIEWTNRIARAHAGDYAAVASLGDDHEPVTPGWDTLLLAALSDLPGPGIAYGDDTLQGQNLPTAPVISAAIIRALGWCMYPGFGHYYADNAWKALAQPDRLAWVPGVTIRHHHYAFGTAPRDDVYAAAERHWAGDEAAWRAYVKDPAGLAADRKKIRALKH